MNWHRSSYCDNGHCLEVAWHKSSHSMGGNCLEVGAGWRSARRCDNDLCVEVNHPAPSNVLVRDSKNPDGPVLTFGAGDWRSFLTDLPELAASNGR